MTTAKGDSRDVASEIAYLTRALKAPSLAGLAEPARPGCRSHKEFLAACLQREIAAREAHGGEGRIRAAWFPARKSLKEFDFDHQRLLKRETITHLGTLDFITARGERDLPRATWRRQDPPGHRPGDQSLPSWALGCVPHSVRVSRPLGRGPPRRAAPGRTGQARPDPAAHRRRDRLHSVRSRSRQLFFQLGSARYERASLIVTSNKPFGQRGEVFGDDAAAAAMIDRLVHHAEVIAVKEDSYRLKDRDLGRVRAAAKTSDQANQNPGESAFTRNSRVGVRPELTHGAFFIPIEVGWSRSGDGAACLPWAWQSPW